MELYEYTVHELMDKLEKKEITITELTKAYVDRINERDKFKICRNSNRNKR